MKTRASVGRPRRIELAEYGEQSRDRDAVAVTARGHRLTHESSSSRASRSPSRSRNGPSGSSLMRAIESAAAGRPGGDEERGERSLAGRRAIRARAIRRSAVCGCGTSPDSPRGLCAVASRRRGRLAYDGRHLGDELDVARLRARAAPRRGRALRHAGVVCRARSARSSAARCVATAWRLRGGPAGRRSANRGVGPCAWAAHRSCRLA